jgi:choline dehydrogenase-like flavoprotein
VKSWDVIVAGAGIIGVSLALELRQRGATVLVLDRAEPGSEASSAAAGMLVSRWISAALGPLLLCPDAQRRVNTAAFPPQNFNSLNRPSTALNILRTSCGKIASIPICSHGPLSQPLKLSALKFAGIPQ